MKNTSIVRRLPWLISLWCALAAFAAEPPPQLSARAWLLIDHATGQVLAAQAQDMRIEPASLTKIMTSYVVSAALREGRIRRDQVAPVSEKAWRAPGSRMFIAPDQRVTIDELISGMVIQSGNDATIALAEAVAGSEEAFVALMNAEARRLGMTQTNFANATGLPDPAHYTTAADLAKLTTALIRDFPEDYKRYAVKEYTWNKIKQPNRNRLLWLDPAVDGVKTGHTETAGYCLIASRYDGARRLTAIVLGAASDAARVQETTRLLHYGLRAYAAARLYEKGQTIAELSVFKGKDSRLRVGVLDDLVLSIPREALNNPERLSATVSAREPLLAPVQKGEVVATLKLAVDGAPLGEFPLVALADVPVAGFFKRAWDTLKLWLQ
ncbi:MAG: D-alanyl-D-alanine carboxypeptidase [Rhodocyclaceae bacterium]|nr:D-alanyl-D-alanine carboxypeptidase [Rhodocyclaceae bacterium]